MTDSESLTLHDRFTVALIGAMVLIAYIFCIAPVSALRGEGGGLRFYTAATIGMLFWGFAAVTFANSL